MYEDEKKEATEQSFCDSQQKIKAENMDEAIRYISQVVNHAEELLLNISEPCPQTNKEAQEKQPPPSLESILNYGPERIRGSCDDVHALIDKIAKVLI